MCDLWEFGSNSHVNQNINDNDNLWGRRHGDESMVILHDPLISNHDNKKKSMSVPQPTSPAFDD